MSKFFIKALDNHDYMQGLRYLNQIESCRHLTAQQFAQMPLLLLQTGEEWEPVQAQLANIDTSGILIEFCRMPTISSAQYNMAIQLLSKHAKHWRSLSEPFPCTVNPELLAKLIRDGIHYEKDDVLCAFLDDKYLGASKCHKLFTHLNLMKVDYSKRLSNSKRNVLQHYVRNKPDMVGVKLIIEQCPQLISYKTNGCNILHSLVERVSDRIEVDEFMKMITLFGSFINLEQFANEICPQHGSLAHMLTKSNSDYPIPYLRVLLPICKLDMHIEWNNILPFAQICNDSQLLAIVLQQNPSIYQPTSILQSGKCTLDYFTGTCWHDYAKFFGTPVKQLLETLHPIKQVPMHTELLQKWTTHNKDITPFMSYGHELVRMVQDLEQQSLLGALVRNGKWYTIFYSDYYLRYYLQFSNLYESKKHYVQVWMEHEKMSRNKLQSIIRRLVLFGSLPTNPQLFVDFNLKPDVQNILQVQYTCELCKEQFACHSYLKNHYQSKAHTRKKQQVAIK